VAQSVTGHRRRTLEGGTYIMFTRRRLAIGAVAVGISVVVAACGGDDADTGTGEDVTDPGQGSGSLTVGGANFTEMRVMQEIYRLLLEDAGYDVNVQPVDNREIYEPALESGEIDIVPEYAATMAEFLNAKVNGPDAPSESPVATTDSAETVAAIAELGADLGLVVLEPAEAASQNGFAVSQEFADANGGLSTLSELAALGMPLTLAATEECPDRPFCQPGLEATYGLEFTEVLPLGFGSPQTKESVVSGEAELGLVGTPDGTLEGLGLVLLEDDQNLQLADNLVPVVNADTAADDTIADVLNQLAGVLTTDDLAMLNAQVDAERQLEEDVARAYLEDKGLI
jgi:osmoprotectant transport system substrate-binding protein